MDSMEVNKGVAAILVAGIAFFITGLLGDNLVYETEPAKPPVAFPTAQPAGAGPAKPAGPEPIIPLLASANVQKGDQFVHQVCAACHSLNEGGKPIVGPNLWGIVGAPHDHEQGFDYSAALEKYKGQPWTYEALNKWLYDPAAYAPGTRMTYAGIKNTQTRADVIAYLRTLSKNPVPLPSPEEVKKVEAQEAAAQAKEKAAAPSASAQKPAGPPSIDPLLASANVKEGDTLAHQICAACHSLNKGGPAIVGPNLWGIVDAPHDHMAGFNYSPALEKYKGQPWTYEALNKWLYDPAAYAPGTRMTFAGIKNTQQRADLIAYLRTLSDNPVPLPKVQPTAAAETAPAPGTAAPAGNRSALGNAASPNSAPAASPKIIGPPGQSYNANAQTPHVGTKAGGTGATPNNPPGQGGGKP
jgi:cytochrome c